jgi:hypothetical protein
MRQPKPGLDEVHPVPGVGDAVAEDQDALRLRQVGKRPCGDRTFGRTQAYGREYPGEETQREDRGSTRERTEPERETRERQGGHGMRSGERPRILCRARRFLQGQITARPRTGRISELSARGRPARFGGGAEPRSRGKGLGRRRRPGRRGSVASGGRAKRPGRPRAGREGFRHPQHGDAPPRTGTIAKVRPPVRRNTACADRGSRIADRLIRPGAGHPKKRRKGGLRAVAAAPV